MSIFVSDNVYCDSYDCPYGYTLIDNADDVKCKGGKCSKDQCCKKGEALPQTYAPRIRRLDKVSEVV